MITIKNESQIEKMRRAGALIHEVLDKLRGAGLECFEPRGAFYMFPCIKDTGMTSAEFCERVLVEEHVAAIPGSAFGEGGEGFVRMCYASSLANLAEAMERLDRFLKRL